MEREALAERERSIVITASAPGAPQQHFREPSERAHGLAAAAGSRGSGGAAAIHCDTRFTAGRAATALPRAVRARARLRRGRWFAGREDGWVRDEENRRRRRTVARGC